MHHLRGEPRSEQDASAEDSIRSPGGGGGGWAVWKEKDSREEEATAFELKDCAPLSLSLSLSLSVPPTSARESYGCFFYLLGVWKQGFKLN
jgi:hypothetical protein